MVPSKVIRCCWDDTFAEFLSNAAPEIKIWPKSQGSEANSKIFMVTIVTMCGYHSNQLFLSRPIPTHVVGKIRQRTMA